MEILTIFNFITLLLLLLKNPTAYSLEESDATDLENYKRFLFTSTIKQHHTRKFIVDLLWRGVYELSRQNMPQSSCITSLKIYIHGVLKTNEMWALKMYDASSGNQPGFLTGNIQDIGSYDECIQVNHRPLAISGKYCKVILNDTSSPLQDHIALKDIPVSYALCIPSNCTAQSVKYVLNAGAKSIYSDLLFTVDEGNCFSGNHRQFTNEDWIAIIIFTVVIGLCILATAYENFLQSSRNEKVNDIILSFSLKKNGGELLTIKNNDERINMLDGLRFLLMIWIILIHRFSQVHSVPAMGIFKWNFVLQDWSRAFITNGFICVDTFFVIGGLLLSYNFLNKMEKQVNFSFIQLYIHRYIRLTPALAGLVLLYATFSDRMSEGPLSVSFYSSIKAPCVKNWWAALLYINNYYDTDNMCGIQSWYNSIDMQLYLLSPVLLYPLMHHPWIISYLLTGLISLSVLISIIQPFNNHISAGYFIIGKLEDHRAFLENYIYTHTRVGSWLIGFALGIYLHSYKRNPFSLPRKTVIIGWIFSITIFVGVIFSILPFQQETHKYDPVYDTLYKSLHRHIWALASSWLIFACATGHGGFINKFLSWDGFLPLGRLTYCIHLTHILIQKLQMASQRTPINFTDMTRITIAFGDIVGSVFSAAILYFLFEAPATALEKVFLHSGNSEKKVFEKGLELQNGEEQ